MLLSKLKTVTVGLLLVALFIGAAGAIYQTQAAEPPKDEQGNKSATELSRSQVLPSPPKVDVQREYVIRSKLVEAGAGQPMQLVQITLEDGQSLPFPLHIADGPQNLLEKVILDEKIKIGIVFDVRVKRLLENKVRLFCSLQRNELDKASVSEILVLGNNVQAIQDVELHKPVKIVFQKDAKGSARRWVEITVDEQPVPAPAVSGPQQKGGKKLPEMKTSGLSTLMSG